ncbi:MAG: heavy-metal-associated domain-containing protein [Planctomycetota bacterium]|jgi:copper chaperone CopZ
MNACFSAGIRATRPPIVGIGLLTAALAVGGCSGNAEPDATVTPVAAQSEGVTLQFAVEGMHCGGCAKAIEGTVAKLPGVASCEASFEDGAATVVTSDPSASAAVIEAIVGLGYEARLADEPLTN